MGKKLMKMIQRFKKFMNLSIKKGIKDKDSMYQLEFLELIAYNH